MTTRYDVLTSHKDKDGKWHNLKIGVAFPKDDRIDLILEAAPFAGADGVARLTLFPAKPKDSTSGKRQPGDELDDQVPF